MLTEAPIDHSREMDERSWWDLWNTSYRATDELDETPVEHFQRIAALVSEVAPVSNSTVLEVGCGTGTLSRSLECGSYHGLDISAAAVDIAVKKAMQTEWHGHSIPAYEAMDFHEWTLPRDRFDLVLCVDAISGFRDQALTMRKIAQSLREGGRVIVSTPNPFVYNRIRRTGGVKLESGPVSHWLSRSELHELVKQAGLALERSFTIMPRGNMGILRIINSYRLDRLLGQTGASFVRRRKEQVGLGQYRVVVARKA